jgi:DNA-binding response OmpR family regulator
VAHILIIDDDDLFRMMLKDLLEMEGYDVSEAGNGEMGVALFVESHPDLVITDILMPDKEGFQTIRELRQESPDVKIIAISGGARRASAPDYLILAEDFGADRTFPKPFDRIELLQAIRELTAESAKCP